MDVYTTNSSTIGRRTKRIAMIAVTGAAIWSATQLAPKFSDYVQHRDVETKIETAITEGKNDLADDLLHATKRLTPEERVSLQHRISDARSRTKSDMESNQQKDTAWRTFEGALKQHDTNTAATALEEYIAQAKKINPLAISDSDIATAKDRIKNASEWFMYQKTILRLGEERVSACYEYLTEFPTSDKRQKVITSMITAHTGMLLEQIAQHQQFPQVALMLRRTTEVTDRYKGQKVRLEQPLPANYQEMIDAYLLTAGTKTNEPIKVGSVVNVDFNASAEAKCACDWDADYRKERDAKFRHGSIGVVERTGVWTLNKKVVVVDFNAIKYVSWSKEHSVLRKFLNHVDGSKAVYYPAELQSFKLATDADRKQFKAESMQLQDLLGTYDNGSKE